MILKWDSSKCLDCQEGVGFLMTPTYCSVVGSWDPSLQGAPKNNNRGDSQSMHLPLFIHFCVYNSSHNPLNSPMRSRYQLHFADKEAESQRGQVLPQGHTARKIGTQIFRPHSLLTGIIPEPFCNLGLGSSFWEADLYTFLCPCLSLALPGGVSVSACPTWV